MEPAELQRSFDVLHYQGIRDSVLGISDVINGGSHLRICSCGPTVCSAVAKVQTRAAPQRNRKPCLPPPDCYLGEPGSCCLFLAQGMLVFKLQPSTFPSEQATVAYMITQLGGKVRLWGTTFWESGHPGAAIYASFAEEIRRVFHWSSLGHFAARQLLCLRQKQQSFRLSDRPLYPGGYCWLEQGGSLWQISPHTL